MKLTINKTEEIKLTEREEMIYRRGRKSVITFFNIFFLLALGFCSALLMCIGIMQSIRTP